MSIYKIISYAQILIKRFFANFSDGKNKYALNRLSFRVWVSHQICHIELAETSSRKAHILLFLFATLDPSTSSG